MKILKVLVLGVLVLTSIQLTTAMCEQEEDERLGKHHPFAIQV